MSERIFLNEDSLIKIPHRGQPVLCTAADDTCIKYAVWGPANYHDAAWNGEAYCDEHAPKVEPR